jgi:hypothetical protein
VGYRFVPLKVADAEPAAIDGAEAKEMGAARADR